MKIFDTHAHLNDKRFDEDREELIASLKENGVDYYCEIAYDMESAYRAYEISKNYDFIYSAVGVHPHDSKELTEEDLPKLKELLSKDKVVALGETGLDYYYDNSPREVQKEWFIKQIELANELKLPIIIHDRDAHGDVMEVIRRHPDVKGILHSFSGSTEMARELVELGYYISFSGTITFTNARKPKEVAAVIPKDRILIETD